MDLLSDVFSTLRLRGELYFRTELRGRWGVTLPAERETIRFHLAVRGGCWIQVGDDAPVRLREGEFALVPHGAAQTLSSDPGVEAVAVEDLDPGPDGILRYGRGGSDPGCRLLCGFCRFDERLPHPIFAGLPPLLSLGASSPWLAEAIRVTTTETSQGDPGMRDIIRRLIEVLFIQAIRYQMQTRSDDRSPFLTAISDRALEPALVAIHERFAEPWTVSGLAKVSGMSRTKFAERFKDVLQQTPMQYLTDWRFQKARQWLTETDWSIADVATRTGYQSLPSFTRRFTERFDISPAAFRRRSIGNGRDR